MNVLFYFLIIYGLLLLIISINKFFKKRKEKKKLLALLIPQIKTIKKAVDEFERFLNLDGAYFSNYRYESWALKYIEIRGFLLLNSPNYEKIGLKNPDVNSIKEFLNFSNKGENIRSTFNQQFVKREKEKYNDFFSDVEGNSLDDQQRHCVITDEDNNLVIAGAGSGKTTTIVGKVKYIINRYKIKPENILLISFTKASAKDLTKRVNFKGIEVRTFHGLGNEIIRKVENGKPSIYDTNQFRRHINTIFKNLQENQTYLDHLTNYMIKYMKMEKSSFEFNSQDEYIQFMRDQGFKTYKQKNYSNIETETINREIVKSIEECQIANFLFFNRINYEYEYPYEHETRDLDYRQYKPDFTIFQNGEKVYLEHFGIDRDGNVPPFFANEDITLEEAKQKYNQGIEWKRNLHQEYNTSLIETFSYEKFEGTLFENLTSNLDNLGITLDPMSPKEKWNVINEMANEEISALVDLFIQFLGLFKSNNHTIQEITSKVKNSSGFDRERNELFLKLFFPIYSEYQQILRKRSEIDFSDMINQAKEYIDSGRFIKNYEYIIVDEFQDISQGRYQLLKSIKNSNPGSKLFCVGDDWQSIYRFTGSDSSLFSQFEKYFGVTSISKIETTYRFKQPIINISSKFIIKNPSQIKKQLRTPFNNSKTDLKIIYSKTDNNDDTRAFKKSFLHYVLEKLKIATKGKYEIDELSKKLKTSEFDAFMSTLEQQKYIILGRNNRDFNRLDNLRRTSSNKIEMTIANRYHFDFEFLTIHKSKGLQADVVFILNCNSGKYGFPNEISDDPIMELLLSHPEQYPNAEERRLFYVALTRAKERTICIANVNHISKFIYELDNNPPEEIKKCPLCKRGILKLRTGPYGSFYGCSNYNYGCRYSKKV